jgi:hypothetical protein
VGSDSSPDLNLRRPVQFQRGNAPLGSAMRWWTAVVDRSYPVWSAGIVLVLGGLAAAIAVAAGWAQAPKARLLVIAATFLAAVAAAGAQLRLTARNQSPTSSSHCETTSYSVSQLK